MKLNTIRILFNEIYKNPDLAESFKVKKMIGSPTKIKIEIGCSHELEDMIDDIQLATREG